jgi:probable rRNA maturation factor
MTGPRRRRAGRPLDVVVTDARGRPVPSRGLPAFLAAAAPRGARGAMVVALIGDQAMRRLNRQFRDKDRATDVLSFPADPPGANVEVRPSTRLRRPEFIEGRTSKFELSPGFRLGDVAIALGVAGRQARRFGHSLDTELRVLALHGLLHLLGYDHDTDQGEMGRVEERLRKRAGLPVGLISRAPGRTRHR